MIIDPAIARIIYTKSWEGAWFGEDGVLAIYSHLLELSRHLKEPRQRADILSGYASSCYGATGNALARLKKAPWKFWWGYRAIRCALEALHVSDALAHELGGIKHMTPEELDIRQSILKLFPSRRSDAARCIREVLYEREGVSAQTTALVSVSYAELFFRLDRGSQPGAKLLLEALEAVKKFEHEDPRQAARVYKAAARVLTRIGSQDSERCAGRARTLAEAAGAKDQLIKMGAAAA